MSISQTRSPYLHDYIYIKYLWHTEDIVQAYKYHRGSSVAFKIIDFVYPLIEIVNIAVGLYGIAIEQRLESIGSIIFGLPYP